MAHKSAESIKINLNRYTYSLKHNFFQTWTPEMAYVLGFVFADASMDRNNTTLAMELQNRDKEILESIKVAMESTHPILPTRNGKYLRLRINSRQMVYYLKKLGVTHDKSKHCLCPKVPGEFLPHFLRGFIDGDGWITTRTGGRRNEISVGFCHGSKEFVSSLVKQIRESFPLTRANLRTRQKITKNGRKSIFYSIEWYADNAIVLLDSIYRDADIFLKRKRDKYLLGRKIYEEHSLKTPLWRKIEANHNKPLKQVFSELRNKGMNGIQIAKVVGVSDAHIYRLLEKVGVNVRSTNDKEANSGRRS